MSWLESFKNWMRNDAPIEPAITTPESRVMYVMSTTDRLSTAEISSLTFLPAEEVTAILFELEKNGAVCSAITRSETGRITRFYWLREDAVA